MTWDQQYAELSTGIRMAFLDKGTGTPVVFCHGWPELGYSWRHQVKPVVEAGFRVIIPDQRGFGNTTCPPDVSAYTHENICADLAALFDHLKIPQVILVGHDWGGAIVWQFTRSYKERVIAVASLCTPLMQPHPTIDPLTAIKANPRQFDYQLYFQDEGVAEKEFERDIEHTFRCLFRSTKEHDKPNTTVRISMANVRERGGVLVGFQNQLREVR